MTASVPLLAALARPSVSVESDAELLVRFVTNRRDVAFAELVRRYARLVWRVARTRCRSDATAEDVFQATFVLLDRKASGIRSPAALAGWLHRTAHRLAVKATRKERTVAPLPPELSHIADPLDALTARELLSAVDDELAKLSDAERAVLLLCGIDGVSNSDAATRLGWSAGAVKGRLERARAKLRDRLSARGLALPAVLVGIVGFVPPAGALDEALTIPTGSTLSPAIAKLLSETFTMKAKAALTASAVGLFFLVGGLMTDGGAPPAADAATRVRRAPVPKDPPTAVLWSQPVRVDWKASGATRIGGVWSPDGKVVIVPRAALNEKGEPLPGGGIDFRDAATGTVLKALAVSSDAKRSFQPIALAVSPDGKAVYASGSVYEGSGKAEVPRGYAFWKDVEKPKEHEFTTDTGATDAPLSLTANGKHLATFSPEGAVEIRQTGTGRTLSATKVGGKGRAVVLADYPVKGSDNGSILVGSEAGELTAIGAATGKIQFTLRGLGMRVRALAVSGNGEMAAGGEATDGAAITLFGGLPGARLNEPAVFKDAIPAKERINGLSFSPDNKFLAAACSDGFIRVFETATGAVVASAKEHKEEVFCVAYSSDGKRLLTVGRDAVKVWDIGRLMAK